MLVGTSRIRVVRDLADEWDTAVNQSRMGLVVIEGPTGIGKTAVVQGLYEQLAMRQARPYYWPKEFAAVSAHISDFQDVIARQAGSKRIFPMTVAPEEGSRMEFFWCGMTARIEGFAALDVYPQMTVHVQGIAEAVQRGDRLTRDRLKAAVIGASLLASHGLLGALLAGLVTHIQDAQTVGGLAKSVPDLLQSRAGLLDKARRRNSGTVFSVTARAQAEAAAENEARWLGLTANLLPLFIAVEDAQFLDSVSIDLLQHLSRQPGAAGLIVLTVDADQPSAAAERASWLNAGEWAQRLTRVRLGPLSAAELTEIAVAELGTELNSGNLARVINHAAGVPGTLYDLLEAPAVVKMLREGGAGPADLSTISAAQGVRAVFSAARAPLRHALAAASVHGRITIRAWLPDPDSTGDAIKERWLLPRPGTEVLEFASSRLLDVVRAEQNHELTPAEILSLRQGLLTAIMQAHADSTWDNLGADVRESLLATVVEEDPEPPASLTAELFDLRRLTGRAAADAEFLEEITERLASGKAHPRALIVTTAEALFDAGRLDQAFQLLSDDLNRLRDQYGHDHPRTRPALHNLAAAYAGVASAVHGHPESAVFYQKALALYEELLQARVNARPPEPEQIIITRDQYAHLLAECYRYSEAIAQGQVLLREQNAARGPDHPDTLITRASLASWQREAGDFSGAAATLARLIPDQVRVLGAHDSHTLTTRMNWAVASGQAGDWTKAVTELEHLLPDQLLILGSCHPDTMHTRFSLAHARGEAGDASGAVALYQELLPDRVRVLGRDHPSTLSTRANLAYWRGKAGHYADAITAYEELLSENERILGPDDPRTLRTRANIAYWNGQAGNHGDAIRALEDLLRDRVRVLGPDHPDTLKTRANIANQRGEAGDPAAAVAAYEELLLDQVRVLGENHPDTLTMLNSYHRWSQQHDIETQTLPSVTSRGSEGVQYGTSCAARSLVATAWTGKPSLLRRRCPVTRTSARKLRSAAAAERSCHGRRSRPSCVGNARRFQGGRENRRSGRLSR